MQGRLELMQRALDEAARARGRTRPNPMVGCVIARGDEIVGVGYHERAGKPHAEAMALRMAGEAARGADVYVTLEPCNHQGRTGPCTEALLKAGVRRVFVGARDPNPLVNGRGLRKLRKAGIEVEAGLLEPQCRRLNEAYESYISRGRPLVVAKLAQSLDGRVATRTGKSQWITGEKARRAGHVLRNELDAIMVGRGTVVADDPRLTCRIRGGRDPVRIVVDSEARTSPEAAIVQQARQTTVPTWIAVGPNATARRRTALEKAGALTFEVELREGGLDLESLLASLREREIMSVLVEGGPTLLGSLFDARLVDKVHAFVAPMLIGGVQALPSVGGLGADELEEAMRLDDLTTEWVGADLLITGYTKRPTRRAKKTSK